MNMNSYLIFIDTELALHLTFACQSFGETRPRVAVKETRFNEIAKAARLMARIVMGLGTSHSLMLNASAAEWCNFATSDLSWPLLDRQGRPTTYPETLANADPTLAARVTPESLASLHAATQAAVARVAAQLQGAHLDLLIVIGDDQHELFHAENMPSLLVYSGQHIRNETAAARGIPAHLPDWMKAAISSYCEDAVARDYPAHQPMALKVIETLVERDFDVSVSERLPAGKGEGHAFGFVHRRLMGERPIPMVPVCLNTYYPPNQVPPRRCYEIGQAIRAAVEAFPENLRVGVLASGGLSHFVVNEPLDLGILQSIKAKDAAALQRTPANQLNSGSSEIRNWICAAGALEGLDLQWSEYHPGYRTAAGTGTGLTFAGWA